MRSRGTSWILFGLLALFSTQCLPAYRPLTSRAPISICYRRGHPDAVQSDRALARPRVQAPTPIARERAAYLPDATPRSLYQRPPPSA
jgi:hypothetical protein